MSGPSAFDQALASAEAVDPWPEPQPLPSGLAPVQQFDLTMLPDPLAPWVADISESMQIPAEYIAVTAMVAAGSVIGRKVGVRPQLRTSWYEVPNLWGCIVGRPGVMKSPALQAALQPLQRIQSVARTEYDKEQRQFECRQIELEVRSDEYRKLLKARIKGNPLADTSDLVSPYEEEPKLRRYIANDTSYQSLGELLRENPNGLLVHRDELMSLLKGLDQEQNVEARGFYLSAWSGTESYTFDRIGRGLNLHIPSVTVSMIGSTQPGRLREYILHALNGGAGDDGLIQRFGMLVWPDVSKSWVEHDRDPDSIARSRVSEAFERLDRMTAQDVGAELDQSEEARPHLRFDQDAQPIFKQWRANLERRLRSEEMHPALESHIGKYRKLVPALALIHHLVAGRTGAIGVSSVLAALSWAGFLESHAVRAYSSATDIAADSARTICRRLRKGDLSSQFTRRELTRPRWSGLTDKRVIDEALELLEEYDWICSENKATGPKGGRPTVIYTANPKGLSR